MLVLHDNTGKKLSSKDTKSCIRSILSDTLTSQERLEDLFERCYERFPQKTAIICEDSKITYLELEQRANRLARYLIGLGIGPGRRVGILLHRGRETYVSLLAVLKAKAAYVPLDPGFPRERIEFIAKDAELAALITTSRLRTLVEDLQCQLIFLDEEQEKINAQRPNRPVFKGPAPPDKLCYIIYTSGSTGQPKGVAIEHPSICNFVTVAAKVYDIRETDIIYQGMTIAFDFSVEEIWLGLTHGATIVAGPQDERRIGNDLADFLIENKVTVFCCVPTLLATIDKDIPTVRTLIVGGEPCPPHLVERWWRPGRRILNTYGPTETTVTATYTELKPGTPVTIGKPLPTYTVYILDEDGRPVPPGEVGEICIAGIGLARGYVNLEEKTRQCFIEDTFNTPGNPSGKIYKTGDLGRINADGDIEYLGRKDTQVKIRGYRIELSEIESVIMESPEIKRAVVSALETAPGTKELAAYYELKEGVSELDIKDMVTRLKEKLPPYMVPSFWEKLDRIPELPSGKVDRKALPAPKGPRVSSSSNPVVLPRTETEKAVAKELQDLMNLKEFSVDDDLFLDLGAHSLIVAQLVSKLRRHPGMEALALRDVYRHPTVRGLARFLDEMASSRNLQAPNGKTTSSTEKFLRIPGKKILFSGVWQLLAVCLFTSLYALPGLYILHYLYEDISWSHPNLALLTGLSLLGIAAIFSVSLTLPVLLNGLLLRGLKPGSYPLWSSTFLRFWLVDKALALAAPFLFVIAGTPLLTAYYRLFGAKIGKKVTILSPLVHLPHLVTIGDRSSINTGSHIFCYTTENNRLIIGPVTVGKDCVIGSNSVLMPNSSMKDGAILGDQSLLSSFQTIPENSFWAGSPASDAGPACRNRLGGDKCAGNRLHPLVLNALFVLGITVLLAIPGVAALPGMLTSIYAYEHIGPLGLAASAPVGGLLFVVLLNVIIVCVKNMVLPRIESGSYSTTSLLYVRKWLVDRLMEMSLLFTNSLYATLYLAPFLRGMGAKVGRLAEVSTISFVTPELLEIGDESFLADIAHVGPVHVEADVFTVKPVVIGKRSFIGNAAFVPGGTTIGDNALIGVLSVPPGIKVPPETTWLGSPPILFPKREQSWDYPEDLTYSPPKGLILRRLGYEYFRVTLPATLSFLGSGAIIWLALLLMERMPITMASLALGPIAIVVALGLTLVVAAIKWTLIGVYVPRVRPMWSSFVWRSELVTALYENVVVPWLLGRFTGTPFVRPILGLLGAKIGKRCFIETTFLTEFDLVEVGCDCCIGPVSSLQTHLFEDRVMKMSRVRIGNRCSIGPRAVVLYDSVLEDDVSLDALSLVMKGETLSRGTSWHGSPAVRKMSKDKKMSNEYVIVILLNQNQNIINTRRILK